MSVPLKSKLMERVRASVFIGKENKGTIKRAGYIEIKKKRERREEKNRIA